MSRASADKALETAAAMAAEKYGFDLCVGGLPCMQTTTGCAPGTCGRKRGHPFTKIEGSDAPGCLICLQLATHALHAKHPYEVHVPLDSRHHTETK